MLINNINDKYILFYIYKFIILQLINVYVFKKLYNQDTMKINL